MKPFLDKVVDHYLTEKENAGGDICIVTPNRRAGLYIRSYISKKLPGTMWAPDILSLEDFINRLSGLKIVDNITVMMEFYRVVKNREKENSTHGVHALDNNSFDELLNWAPMLLQDFDEIDSNIEDTEEFFNNLSDIKKMEAWSPGQEPTPFQKQYIEFFKTIPYYHKMLTSNLLSKKTAYQGLSHRVAAAGIEKTTKELSWQKVIFAGLNALNQSEEKIISTLLNQDKAIVIWDADDYYTLGGKSDDTNHEAGTFIRRYSKKWQKNTITVNDNCFKEETKSIHILGIAKNINQVQLAGNILRSRIAKEDLEKTAVVLTDETLMTPMLSAIPKQIDKVNITMGYPLSQTGFYSFVVNILSLHIRVSGNLNDEKPGHPGYYYKDILQVLKHPYSNIILAGNDSEDISTKLINSINNSNRGFYTLRLLKDLYPENITPMLEHMFSGWNNSPRKALEFLKESLHILEDHLFTTSNRTSKEFSIDIAALNRFNLLLNRFELYLESYNQPSTLQSFKLVLRNLVAGINIPFSGEPLEGLQVMGMLETRNLDFKNLVIFPVNESILPKGKTQNSFLPYDLKKRYGLHTHKERDAIYAYHFFRLLQRAENIYLAYNTQTDDTGGGEKSRFITQVEYELSKYNPGIKINHEIIPLTESPNIKSSSPYIKKTPGIMEQIKKTGEKGFSPSSLSIYLRCSLQFYFMKILNIEEAGEVEETIEQKTLGLAIHDVLEKLFEPYKGMVIKEEFLDISNEELEKITKEKFSNHYSGGDINTGKNYLLFRVALRMINNYLKSERSTLRSQSSQDLMTTVLSLEKPYESVYNLTKNGNDTYIKLKGKADRIDKTDNLHRIVDYKTGKVEAKELYIKEWKDLLEDTGTAKSFQLLCYSWLYLKEHNDVYELLPGIVSFRYPSQGLFTMKHPLNDKGIVNRQAIKEFQDNILEPLLSEIYDINIPFRQTSNEEACKYCSFNVVCGRL